MASIREEHQTADEQLTRGKFDFSYGKVCCFQSTSYLSVAYWKINVLILCDTDKIRIV